MTTSTHNWGPRTMLSHEHASCDAACVNGSAYAFGWVAGWSGDGPNLHLDLVRSMAGHRPVFLAAYERQFHLGYEQGSHDERAGYDPHNDGFPWDRKEPQA